MFLPAIAAGILGWFVMGRDNNLFGSHSNDAFIFACVPIIIFYFSVWYRCSGFDRKRIGTLFTLFGVAIIFWNIYNQNATSLTIWADSYTKRDAPQFSEKVLSKFGFLNTITNEKKEVPVLDYHFHAKTDASGKVITEQGVDPYLHNIPKNEWPAEGRESQTDFHRNLPIHQSFLDHRAHAGNRGIFRIYEIEGEGNVDTLKVCLGNHHCRAVFIDHGDRSCINQYLRT